jgi:hypothetical protein
MNKYSGQPRREIKHKLAQEKQFMKYFFFYEDITSVMGGYTYDEKGNERILLETKKRIGQYKLMLDEKENNPTTEH